MYKFMSFKVPLKGAYFLVLLSFMVSLSISFLAPVFPLYIKTLVPKEAYVGYVSAAIAVLLLIGNFIANNFLEAHKKLRLMRLGLFGCTITIALLSIINQLHYFLILQVFRTFFLVSVFITLALFIREYASTKNLGKLEGMHFTVSNIAWLIGPIFGALLAEKYSIQTIFLISTIFPFIALVLINSYPLREEEIKIRKNKNNIIKNIKDYFKDKDLKVLYFISMGLLMWWAMIYTFTPLFIKSNNLSTSIIGYLFFAITIPLILLEIPIGKLADKHGFKRYFFFGFIIIAIAAILTYFFSIFIVLGLLTLASIGAAFLEPLRETYLLKKVSKEDLPHRFAIYRTSVDIGQIVGPVLFSTILLYSNFRVLYLVVGLLMFIFALYSLKIREIKK